MSGDKERVAVKMSFEGLLQMIIMAIDQGKPELAKAVAVDAALQLRTNREEAKP